MGSNPGLCAWAWHALLLIGEGEIAMLQKRGQRAMGAAMVWISETHLRATALKAIQTWVLNGEVGIESREPTS